MGHNHHLPLLLWPVVNAPSRVGTPDQNGLDHTSTVDYASVAQDCDHQTPSAGLFGIWGQSKDNGSKDKAILHCLANMRLPVLTRVCCLVMLRTDFEQTRLFRTASRMQDPPPPPPPPPPGSLCLGCMASPKITVFTSRPWCTEKGHTFHSRTRPNQPHGCPLSSRLPCIANMRMPLLTKARCCLVKLRIVVQHLTLGCTSRQM